MDLSDNQPPTFEETKTILKQIAQTVNIDEGFKLASFFFTTLNYRFVEPQDTPELTRIVDFNRLRDHLFTIC